MVMSQQFSARVQLGSELLSKEISNTQHDATEVNGLFIRKVVFIRAALAMLLMVGYVGAYLAYGQEGLIVLSLLVLLALGHPFWLIRNAQNYRKRR